MPLTPQVICMQVTWDCSLQKECSQRVGVFSVLSFQAIFAYWVTADTVDQSRPQRINPQVLVLFFISITRVRG